MPPPLSLYTRFTIEYRRCCLIRRCQRYDYYGDADTYVTHAGERASYERYAIQARWRERVIVAIDAYAPLIIDTHIR